MSFVVNANVIDQNFDVICTDIFDHLPDEMAFVTSPTLAKRVFNNIFYKAEISDPEVRRAVNRVCPTGQWKFLVKLKDMKAFIDETRCCPSISVALDDYEDDNVLAISGWKLYAGFTFNEPARTYGYIDPWYIKKGSANYYTKHVYKLSCRPDCALVFYTIEECNQFLHLMVVKDFPLQWSDPIKVSIGCVSLGQEETLDIPVDERADSVCNWARCELDKE